MAEIKEKTVAEIAATMQAFDIIVKSAEETRQSLIEISAMMKVQEQMLRVAIDAMVGILEDDTADLRIRRRLAFALKQIKGMHVQ